MKNDKDIQDLIQKVSYNNRDIETNRGYAWYYYFSYWTLGFFLFHKANLIPYSPYLIYLCIVIFIAMEMIYLIAYQIYFRITDPTNQNIIQDKEAWSIIGAWLILVLFIDLLPFVFLKPQIDKHSILFTLILGIVYLMFLKKQKVNLNQQYFSKGEKFVDASRRYTVLEYIFS